MRIHYILDNYAVYVAIMVPDVSSFATTWPRFYTIGGYRYPPNLGRRFQWPSNGLTVSGPGGEKLTEPQSSQLGESKVLHRSLHVHPKKVVWADGMYLDFDNGQKVPDATRWRCRRLSWT